MQDVQGWKVFRRPISSHVQNNPDQSHFLEKLDRDHVAECTPGSSMGRGVGDDHLDVRLRMASNIMPCKVCQ
jgi:hypothetical protein